MLIICLAVALPLGSSATVAAEPTTEQIQDAVDFRTTFGLPHSISRVEDSYQDPEAYPDMKWGVPLSEDEAGDLLRRLELRAGQDDAVAYAQDKPAFGGLWFDQRDGGAAHYTFTANVAEHRSAILEMAPKGADIHVTQADYRMSELTGIRDKITEDMLSLIDDGMPITMVDANARANRVIVYLAEPQEGAQQSLRERYGAAVITELGAEGVPDCSGRGNCRPMKGGLRIVAEDGAECTSAFQAEKANGDRVLITAGHCLEHHGGSGVGWDHNSNQFGISQGNSLSGSGSSFAADIGWIKIDASEDTTPANTFYGGSSSDIRPIGGVRPNSGQVEGDPVCRSGEQSSYDCGEITNDDTSKPNGEGETITHVWVWDKDSLGGDSGGTMIYTIFVPPSAILYYAAGLHVHSVEVACGDPGEPVCRSWYSTAGQVQNPDNVNGVDLTICTDSDC